MRVIFVGIHNKPGLTPLCSTTKSGKLIDRVIARVKCDMVLKTNLYDVDEMPIVAKEVMAVNWLLLHKPTINDIIVLLGNEVFENFDFEGVLGYVLVRHHPASKRSRVSMDKYVEELSSQINALVQ